MIEAPGTYNHSIIVATLSEAAASAIHADSLKAKIKFLNGNFGLSPKAGSPKTPQIVSDFQVDSAGAVLKGKRVALIQGKYDLKSTRVGRKWPLEGRVTFGTMYAFTPGFPLQVEIPKTEIVLEPGLIELDHAMLKVGQSDITATGRVYDIGDAFLEDKMLKGELEITSELIDVNEMIYALNEGAEFRNQNREIQENEATPAQEENPGDAETGQKEEPRSFVVPANLDLRFESRFKEVRYKKYSIKDVRGLITVKDQVLNLSALQMNTMAANMASGTDQSIRLDPKASPNQAST